MRNCEVRKREEWEDYVERRSGEKSEEMRSREEGEVRRLCGKRGRSGEGSEKVRK